jgi:hypothetical protein
MSVFEENIHPAPAERQFDLLVDGELGEAERRALLLQLEHQPDGWRRCALAFLEAQCWKAELGQVVPRAAAEPARPEPVSQVQPAPRLQRWRQYAATTLTIAASFLIALVVGMGLRGNWSGGLHSPGSALVHEAIDFSPNGDASPAAAGHAGTADNWETVMLTPTKPDGQAETFPVQAVRRNTLDQAMLDVPDVIPPELQRAFERSGHRVVQQREIVPVQMKDGRRLVVPVDHVEIHYVGRPSL